MIVEPYLACTLLFLSGALMSDSVVMRGPLKFLCRVLSAVFLLLGWLLVSS